MNDKVQTSSGIVVCAIDNEDTVGGKYVKRSRICPICVRRDHMEINTMRSRLHMSYTDIAAEKNIAREALVLHFKNHFILSKVNQDILDLKENNSQESNEIVTKILEGDIDFFGAAQGVLTSKMQRLLPIQNRLKYLSDKLEIDDTDESENQEFIMLNKLAEEIENSIMKVHVLLDKKLFPSSKEEITRAVMAYKLSILNKFVDEIVLILLEFERIPEYRDLIQQIRYTLAHRISVIESSIIKSGGEIRALEVDSGDAFESSNE